MKIDELVSSINGLKGLKAVKGKKSIDIYPSAYSGFDYFLDLDFDTGSWDEVDFDYDCLDDVKPNKLGLALQYVDEFLQTPIKKRFPEKKYRLRAMRYVEGPIAIKQYVTGFYANCDWMRFNFGTKEDAREFTDEELRDLSQWFPREAIDAMKEPVEDN